MGRTAAVLLGGTALLALAACGSATATTATVTVTSTVTGATTSQPSATAAASTTATTVTSSTASTAGQLAVVTDETQNGSPNKVSVVFFQADGAGTPPKVLLVQSSLLVTVSAGAVWIVDPAHHLVRVRADGSTTNVATLSPAPTSTGLAVSADGSQWLWAVADFNMGTSEVWIGGMSTAAHRVVAQPVSTPVQRFLAPLVWPQSGPLVVHEPIGIGGRILYDDAFGQVDRLDVATGTMTKVVETNCSFSDISGDGTIVCADHQARAFTLIFADGHRSTVSVPGQGQFGDGRFDPQGRLLAIGYEIPSGETSDGRTVVATDIVNLETGHHTTASTPGLTPIGWSPDGRLVASNFYIQGSPTSPTYLVDSAGRASSLENAGRPLVAGAAS